MVATSRDFLEQLALSGLLPPEEIQALQETLPEEIRRGRAEDMAKELVRLKKLTRFQATAIYQGKTKGLIFGDYEILDKAGSGGMGQVYRARQRSTGRVVALKVLAGAVRKSEKAIKRFHQETQTAKRLAHPNIVATLDAGETDGVNFLVMEFVSGVDLRSHLKEHTRLPVEEVVGHIIQVAEGLEYAHRSNVVHRDIKPSNLLLEKSGAVKILDMGLARIQNPDEDPDASDSARLTMPGQMLGTAEYMSPEQVEDPRFADARSDIYSLGCTMYYLLNGKPPYRGETMAQTLMAHELSPIPPLAVRRDDISPSLDAVFQRMMAKKPEDRFQSMGEVVAELKAASMLEVSVPRAGEEGETADEAAGGSVGDEYSTLNTLALQSPSLFGEKPAGFRPRSMSLSVGDVKVDRTPAAPAKAPPAAAASPPTRAAAPAVPVVTEAPVRRRRRNADFLSHKWAKLALVAAGLVVVVGLIALVMQAF